MELNKTNEELLSEYYRTGDIEIYGKLILQCNSIVKNSLTSAFKDVFSIEEVEDILSDSFAYLIQENKAPKNDGTPVINWFYIVGKNKLLSELKKKKKRNETLTDSFFDKDFYGIFMELEKEFSVTIDENEIQALKECFNSLKSNQKECLHEKYFNNMNHRDIASKFGHNSSKTVDGIVERAKGKLKICMEGKGYGKKF